MTSQKGKEMFNRNKTVSEAKAAYAEKERWSRFIARKNYVRHEEALQNNDTAALQERNLAFSRPMIRPTL
jgi:hypothetical protein